MEKDHSSQGEVQTVYILLHITLIFLYRSLLEYKRCHSSLISIKQYPVHSTCPAIDGLTPSILAVRLTTGAQHTFSVSGLACARKSWLFCVHRFPVVPLSRHAQSLWPGSVQPYNTPATGKICGPSDGGVEVPGRPSQQGAL